MSKSLLTLGGLGKSPLAPGSLASAVSLAILVALFKLLPNWLWLELGVWLIIFIWTYKLTYRAIKQEIKQGRYDAPWIVADEFLGVQLCFLPFILIPNYEYWWLGLIFLLFRFFDIYKPWGIKIIDQKNTIHSVILDDLAAAGYSLILFYLVITIV